MFRLIGRRIQSKLDPVPHSDEVTVPDPEQAWKTLGLVNEWIRHSDAKAGVTLAFTGVLGTLSFNLVKDFNNWSASTLAVAIAICALLVVTAALCAWTLTPRVRTSESNEASLLFFVSIAQEFGRDRQGYQAALGKLVADPAELTKQIAGQVYENARIATTKAKAAKWAIRVAVVAGGAVATLALIISATTTPAGEVDGRQLQNVQLHQ